MKLLLIFEKSWPFLDGDETEIEKYLKFHVAARQFFLFIDILY